MPKTINWTFDIIWSNKSKISGIFWEICKSQGLPTPNVPASHGTSGSPSKFQVTWLARLSPNKNNYFVQAKTIYIDIHKEPLDRYVFVCFELFRVSAFLPSRRGFENPKITPLGRSDRSCRRRAAWPWDLESCRIWRDVVTDGDVFFVKEFSFSELL